MSEVILQPLLWMIKQRQKIYTLTCGGTGFESYKVTLFMCLIINHMNSLLQLLPPHAKITIRTFLDSFNYS